MPGFSVLISIYHKESPIYFREALDSVFAQNLQPSEIVLVEDGPLTPELYTVIDEYRTKYPIFKIVKNEINLGLGLALAKGVENCSYEYIARMDTDDIIPPDRFEKQYKIIEQGIDVVSCWSAIFINDINNIIATKYRPQNHNDIIKLAHRRSPVCHAAVFTRKSAILAAGNYLHRPYYEDYHLWVRMMLNGAIFHNIQEPLYYVRTTDEQVARRRGLSYLKTELSCMKEFFDIGFYSITDLCINSTIRILVRLMPERFTASIMRIIWNHKS